MESTSELLDKDQVAARARITACTLSRHIANGKGPAVTRIGRRVLFTPADVAAWIEGQRIAPNATVLVEDR